MRSPMMSMAMIKAEVILACRKHGVELFRAVGLSSGEVDSS